MTDISNFDLLDDDRLARDLAEIAGVQVDRWGILDHSRLFAQLESALGVQIDKYAALSCGRLSYIVTHSSEDAPNWVPDNAKVFIDLVNNRAWTEADGEVAIDTLLGSDPNTENGWGATSYSADNLTADGYVAPDSSSGTIAFIGSAKTALLAGATTVIKLKQVTANDFGSSFVIVSADGNHAVECDINGQSDNKDFQVYSWDGPFSQTIADVVNTNEVGALNSLAVTITSDRFDAAINGSDPTSGTLGAGEFPTDTPAVLIDTTSLETALQSITIYDALPDTTGLSALSQIA